MYNSESPKKKGTPNIPDLGKLLPARWNQHTSYDGVEIAEELRKRGIDTTIKTPEQLRVIDDITDELHGYQRWRREEAHSILGLDTDSLEAISASLTGYSGIDAGEYNSITAYAPVVSFLSSIFNKSFKERRIVEIGIGTDGVYALGYMAGLGAVAIGMDRERPSYELLRKHGVKFKKSRWEDMGNHLKAGSVDAIYIHYMEKNPHSGGPFDTMQSLKYDGAMDERGKIDFSALQNKRKADKLSFETHISKTMHDLLVPNGVFINSNIADYVSRPGSEFLIYNPQVFLQQGFSRYVFQPEIANQQLEVMQKSQ